GGIPAAADDRIAANQIDGDREARRTELFESRVVQVLAEHRVEVAAAVLIQEVKLVASSHESKQPRRAEVVGEQVSAVLGVDAGSVDHAGHGPGTRAGDHVDDDAALFERLEHAEVGHAARRAAAEGKADPRAAEVVNDPLQTVTERTAPLRSGRALTELEIAA